MRTKSAKTVSMFVKMTHLLSLRRSFDDKGFDEDFHSAISDEGVNLDLTIQQHAKHYYLQNISN